MAKSNSLDINIDFPVKSHGVSLFTIDKIRPEFRPELEKRIRESAELIPECSTYNRIELIENALLRAYKSGWISSSSKRETVDSKVYLKAKKILNPFVGKGDEDLNAVACVNCDQSHKLTANIHATIAQQGGALGAIWHSRIYPTEEYSDFQDEHQARQNKTFLIRDSWAEKEGLVKASVDGYLDEITQPQDCFMCFCSLGYIHSLARLPPEMLTHKGLKRIEHSNISQKLHITSQPINKAPDTTKIQHKKNGFLSLLEKTIKKLI